jgi:uncharacterized protein
MTKLQPMVDYLVLSDGGAHLEANRCIACGALFFDRRNACARCGQDGFERTPLSTTGTLRTFTIVHRAAPKVKAPYVSCVVELDGGGVIKANLHDTDCDPARIQLGGPVRLTTFVAETDDEGTEAIGFGFVQTDKEGER